MRIPLRLGLWPGLIVLALLAGSTITACQSTAPEAGPSPNGPRPTVTVPFELPITIAIAGRFGGPALAALDEQIVVFEAANPDIKVEIVQARPSLAERREQFMAQLEAGDTSVDIYVLDDAWLVEFAAGGQLTPLDDYARSQDIKLEAFLPASAQTSVVAWQVMALPWTVDGGLLYYRQDLLDQYGYEPPTTWGDLQRIALDVKTQGGPPGGFVWQGAAYESLTCNTLEFVWAYGGDVLDEAGNAFFDSPQTRAGLQQMSDLLTSGASPADVVTYSESRALNAFRQGEAVFMRNRAYAWAALNDEDSPLSGHVGLAPLPASCLSGQNLALSTHSLYPEQAFRFMAFLVGYDQQVHLAKHLDWLPALEAAYHDADLLAMAPIFAEFHAALAVARPRPRTAAYTQVSEAIYTNVNSMLAGEQQVADTAAQVQRRLEEILRPR